MNDFDLVRKNLFRRKLRAILMIVSILIAFMIFGVLAGFYRAFTAGEDRAAADRMITVNKINFTQPMPIAYFNRVRAVEGVRQVTFANWFGGYYQDPKNFIMALAIEPNTYFDVYRSEFEVPLEQLQAFMRDRGSAVVGEKLARESEQASQHQRGLLLGRLHRHKPHRRSARRFTQPLGIPPVILVALNVRLHVSRRHQSHGVTECLELARPMVRRGARLNTNQTGW